MTIKSWNVVQAVDLEPGNMVDLEGDPFADPDSDNPAFPFEYAAVATVDRETYDCIAVGFEGFDVVGFPPDHQLILADGANK